MDKIEALKASIAENGKRLDEIKASGDEASKRIKKRLTQKLGKLKKDLADLTGSDSANASSDAPSLGKRKADGDDGGDDEEGADVKEVSAAPMSKEERKVKLRLLNKDLAEFAQKKQLTFARKRFEQAVRKDLKVDVHSYTNLINAYVRCSDLEGAEQTLQRMIQGNITPNLVTYTTLLKGYSESGDMSEAGRIYFEALRAFRPNVRSLNTFLRACVRTGQVRPALQSYHNFVNYTPDANTKASTTKNQPQQGKQGAGKNAANEEEEDGFECDASSYEYLLGLLCRAGARGAAESVLRSFTELTGAGSKAVSAGGVSAIENSAIYLTLATLHTLQGDYASAGKWADLSADALQRTETAALKDSMLKRFQASAAEADKSTAGSGAKGKKDDQDGSRSVALFLRHRRTELEGQLNLLQDYLGMATANPQSQQSTKADGAGSKLLERLQAQSLACTSYLCCLSQVLPFGFDGRCDFDSLVLSQEAAAFLPGADKFNAEQEQARIQQEKNESSTAARLLIALRDKFGLNIFTPPALSELGLQHEQVCVVEAAHREAVQAVERTRQLVTEKILSAVDKQTEFIDFQKLFTPSGFVAGSAASISAEALALQKSLSKLPVKLEICSGDGEWVVAQAGADWSTSLGTAASPTAAAAVRQPKALWVALELRCDRIQHTLTQYMMANPHTTLHRPPASSDSLPPLGQRLHNLALLGGNAAKIVPGHIAPGSISEIFINHPQPPDRVTGGGDVATEGSSKDKHAQKKNKRDGGKDKNQGAHLLTQEFFAQLVKVLKVGGAITIVTDNQAYAKSLAASIATLPAQTCVDVRTGLAGSTSSEESEGDAPSVPYLAVLAGGVDRYRLGDHWDHSLDDSYPIPSLTATSTATAQATATDATDTNKKNKSAPMVPLENNCGRSVDVWRGEPGLEAGHVVDASSYFDRMWDLGQKKRRWFIYVKKITV